MAEANYLDFFGLRAIAGDARAALGRPDALVLSRGEATRLFGRADALGKVVTIAGTPFVVRAVIADLPANTSPAFEALLGKGLHSWDPPPQTTQDAWFRRARLYLRPAPGVGAHALETALEEMVARERDAGADDRGPEVGHGAL